MAVDLFVKYVLHLLLKDLFLGLLRLLKSFLSILSLAHSIFGNFC